MPGSILRAVAAASVSAALAGAALAASAGPASADDEAPKPAAGSKQVTLAAQVFEDGGLGLRKGVVRVTNSGGAYTVSFNRNVSRCFFSVTPAKPGLYTFSAQPLEDQKRAVLVEFNRDGAQVTAPFYIVATCFD